MTFGSMYELGQQVGHDLLGTCSDIGDHLPDGWEDAKDDLEFCEGLDSVALCCVGCSWWCEPDELNDDAECEDCAEDDEDV